MYFSKFFKIILTSTVLTSLYVGDIIAHRFLSHIQKRRIYYIIDPIFKDRNRPLALHC